VLGVSIPVVITYCHVIRIYPTKTLYDDVVSELKADTTVGTSGFFLRRPSAVPWSVNPTTFTLETDHVGIPHTITLNRDTTVVHVPVGNVSQLVLSLVKGANKVVVTCEGDTGAVNVAATAVEAWFRALGRAFYLNAYQRLADIRQALQHPWTTRLTGHLLPYADLFFPSESIRLHQTRLALTAAIGGRHGFGDGVLQTASALYYCTPFVTKSRDSEFMVPGRDWLLAGMSSAATQSELNGRLLDVWTPNVCSAHKTALVLFSKNLAAPDAIDDPPFTLDDVGDDQLLFTERDGTKTIHRLATDDGDCTQLDQSAACLDNTRAFLDVEELVEAVMLSPQIPFDRAVTKPLHFGFFDAGFVWDGSSSSVPGISGGTALDNVDAADPFGTGFLGAPLRSMDSACFDTVGALGQRLAKFAFPLGTTSPSVPVGSPVVADVDVGAPTGSVGTASVWVTSSQPSMREGYLRDISASAEYTVMAAWPVQGTDLKSGVATLSAVAGSPTVRTASAAAGFFESRHAGCGIRVGTTKCSIRSVSADGSSAVLAGNAAFPTGSATVTVYLPVRDRQSTSVPGFSGNRVFELSLGDNLLSQLATGDQLDYRPAPQVFGSFIAGSAYIEVLSDVAISVNDVLWLTETTNVKVEAVLPISVHPQLGFTVYGIDLVAPTLVSLADGQMLHAVASVSCFVEGDPVTLLSTTSLSPSGYITP
jgi:hypothetical protein